MDQLIYVCDRLVSFHHWVGYRSRVREGGKATKIPVNPITGGLADVSNPATWGSFDQAVQYARAHPGVQGVGFVFSESDPFSGIDFDACRDPLSGAIDPSVRQWVTELDSYTEVSVSGSGLHVIVIAKKAAGGCRKRNVEIYDRRRFFVVTGQLLPGTPRDICPRQAQVDLLHQTLFGQTPKPERPVMAPGTPPVGDDNALVEQIIFSYQGPKFYRLFQGSTAGYGSASQADLALCSILACWTRDEQQIDRIFRSSSLYREKWDAPRGESTYGEMTILRALGNR